MQKIKAELRQLPVEFLQRGKYQPRRQFTQEQLEELAQSIRENGLVQPIVVRLLAENCYEIVAGERRWRAAQLAQLDTVLCLINHYTDEQAAAVTTIENIQRENLNPIEEAMAYQRLLDEFHYIHDEIAAIVGKSRAKITNSLRLLKLDQRIQTLLIEGCLSEGHGKILAGLPENKQYLLAQDCVSKAWSVRQLEQVVKKLETADHASTNNEVSNITYLARKLGDHMGCKVDIDFNQGTRQGKLIIDFHNLDALEGILQKMKFKYEEQY